MCNFIYILAVPRHKLVFKQSLMGAHHREISTEKVCLLAGLEGEGRAAAHIETMVMTPRLGWALASPFPTNYPRKQFG